jgi:hypothetical protein
MTGPIECSAIESLDLLKPPSAEVPLRLRKKKGEGGGMGNVRVLMKVGVAISAIVVSIAAAGCGGTDRSGAGSTITGERATDVNGYGCLKSELDRGRRCPDNPAFGKTQAQLRREARAAARAERRARVAAARRERRARVAAARVAAEARALVAAENAWHKGYVLQDDNVYWRWSDRGSCQDYAENGCWHVEVITRDGCPSYVGVEANEYQGGSVIGDLLDNNGHGIPPKTPELFELDADAEGHVVAGDVTVDCS